MSRPTTRREPWQTIAEALAIAAALALAIFA